MPFDKKSYEKYMGEMVNTINGNSYLKARSDAYKAERKAEKQAKMLNRDLLESELKPILHNPLDQKTAMFDYLLPTMRGSSFPQMLEQIEDQKLADSFVKNLNTLANQQWSLQTPSRENHGMCKIMTPADYDNLLKSYDVLLKQTSLIANQFSQTVSNGTVAKPGFEKSVALINDIHNRLVKDYAPIRDAAKKKEPVPLQDALKNVQTVRMTGDTANSHIMGGVQSTRKVVTIVDANGNEKTGLFTSMSKIYRPKEPDFKCCDGWHCRKRFGSEKGCPHGQPKQRHDKSGGIVRAGRSVGTLPGNDHRQ